MTDEMMSLRGLLEKSADADPNRSSKAGTLALNPRISGAAPTMTGQGPPFPAPPRPPPFPCRNPSRRPVALTNPAKN